MLVNKLPCLLAVSIEATKKQNSRIKHIKTKQLGIFLTTKIEKNISDTFTKDCSKKLCNKCIITFHFRKVEITGNRQISY